jgi:hypothetical protein
MVWLVDDLFAALSTFGTVAGTDPIAAVLLVVAVLVLGSTFGAVGVLGLGALSNLAFGWP